jgi:hypothetical protein
MDTRPAIALAWANFIDACRAAGHSIPGSYADSALLVRDAIDLLDPIYEGDNEPIMDVNGSPLHLLLLDTFNHAVDGCAHGEHWTPKE